MTVIFPHLSSDFFNIVFLEGGGVILSFHTLPEEDYYSSPFLRYLFVIFSYLFPFLVSFSFLIQDMPVYFLQGGLRQILANCYHPQAEAVRSFTYFRMNDKIFAVENWNNFVPFVRKMSTNF